MRSIPLVIAQFTCIGALALGGSWVLPWWAWALFASGLLVLAWAVVSLGGHNLTVMPDPRASSALSVQGIYRFVRHPMYSAVLLCGAGLAFGAPSAIRWWSLTICAVVLILKIKHEEALLTQQHPDYPRRMQGVKRLLPFVW
ncbi:MAG: isoprenylcysteine carboxylmethyltransferase family protein [Flavobacteriales bacterium]|jgi:protein-S-isoprenylcysteine O-methyltransferase Ste14|nr:isoprenylcysteine carboxylmethyltransferase family protein [Flavobacteriales bacterium]